MNNEEQKIRVFTKSFNCLEEVLNDNVCKSQIKEHLKRMNRLVSPPSGMRYKRTGYDALSESGRLNYVYFIQEYPLIEQKKSKLPSSQRQLIEGVVVTAIRNTIEAHSVVVEKGLSFRVKDSDKLEVGYIRSINHVENTVNIKLRTGDKNSEVVWKFDETMDRFQKCELVKI